MDATPVSPRRLRYERHSTGKRVEPTERDMLWFETLHRHGPLPSSYLLAYSRTIRASDTRSRERLGDLFHETNTPHGGAYLDRPRQQWSAISKFEKTVYDLSPAAQQCLADRGLVLAVKPAALGPYHHRLMVSCITASLELAVRENPTLRFIPQAEILARSPNKTLTMPCRISYANTRTGKSQTLEAPVVPDALFGIEYAVRNQKYYRFFVIEADRSNEPVVRASLNETSYLRKVLQYRELVGNGHYRAHFGMKSAMLVLTVTTNTRHMHNIMRMAEAVFGRTGCPYLLFKTMSEFGDQLRVPDPSPQLLSEPWERIGWQALHIDRSHETGP